MLRGMGWSNTSEAYTGCSGFRQQVTVLGELVEIMIAQTCNFKDKKNRES